ncbi:pseudaminic acid biosynthesis-associated methylase [Nitrobacter winogradskyi]|uniref:Spore coat polysaccharide biosynthesis protein SpsF n=2 Tax=Nitrobacter winogradskyi TaxID=913 RepID=A0ACC6ALS0_NITWI|nr:pseudaminic acid biosynthesis-associated methylase [Nitrobacter winogradskyi]MCP2000803.1 spore coat polysaccharide biosynthesis protein SpsF [Nitrobacter winogradskyi]
MTKDQREIQEEATPMTQITAQEEFWAGEFGDNYIGRNQSREVLTAKIAMFARIVQRCSKIRSVRELGANIGLNILALKSLLPHATFQAIEINSRAFEKLAAIPGIAASNTTLFEPVGWSSVDLAFTVGVLIHLNPDMLPVAYQRLYEASNRYVLTAEYYNPSVVEISYRGHSGRLWKRDFAGEMMDRYPDLKLVDYGFIYHRDPVFPADDLTWFLMEKPA